MAAPATDNVAPAAALVLALVLAAGVCLIVITGPVPQLIYPADTANYLDACHDVALHLVQGRDFYSPIGPTALLPTALAMRIGRSTVAALATGAALAWAGYGIVAWIVARTRMSPWLAAAFALFAAGTAAAPYTLDFGTWRVLSYGMLYNRLAWAGLCIAAVPAFLRPLTPSRQPGWSVAGQGAGAAWIALDKPNYLLVLAPLVLWAMFSAESCRRRPGAAVGSFIGGALLLAAAVWCCVPYDPLGLARGWLGMAGEAPRALLIYTLERSLRENWIQCGLLVGGWIAFAGVADASSDRRAARLACLLATLVSAAVFAANMANCQFAEFPIWGALGWILAASCLRAQPQRPRVTAIAAGGVLFGLAFAWQPWASLPYSWLEKRILVPRAGTAVTVDSPAWAGMPMRNFPAETAQPNPGGSAADYANWLNDGLALLGRLGLHGGRVLSLDWSNPFPFALGASPVRGDQIAWHVGRTIGPRSHPDVQGLLTQADVVMEPRESLQPLSLDTKRALFGPGLRENFVLAGESASWRAWVRRKAGGPEVATTRP